MTRIAKPGHNLWCGLLWGVILAGACFLVVQAYQTPLLKVAVWDLLSLCGAAGL